MVALQHPFVPLIFALALAGCQRPGATAEQEARPTSATSPEPVATAVRSEPEPILAPPPADAVVAPPDELKLEEPKEEANDKSTGAEAKRKTGGRKRRPACPPEDFACELRRAAPASSARPQAAVVRLDAPRDDLLEALTDKLGPLKRCLESAEHGAMKAQIKVAAVVSDSGELRNERFSSEETIPVSLHRCLSAALRQVRAPARVGRGDVVIRFELAPPR